MVFDYNIKSMAKQYHVQDEVLKGILSGLFDQRSINKSNNLKFITDIISKEVKDSALEAIIHLMLTERTFVPTEIGSYVRLVPPNYHQGSEFELDVLEDMGLLGKGDEYSDYYVYGQVVGDSSWGSDPYDPFYSTIKVNLMYHDDDKNLKFVETTVSPLHALNIQKRFISYFKKVKQTELNFQEDGKDINGTIEL